MGRSRLLVILSLAASAALAAPAVDVGTDAQREAGKKLYEVNCAQCHGEKGDGDGIAAPFLLPKPRDFTSGKFKIRTTPNGALPTTQDLKKIIRAGMPYTAMPAWPQFNEQQLTDLVYYVKSFDPAFANAERHLKSPAEMRELFADCPDAVARTVEVADRCAFSLDELRYDYPEELSPPGLTPLEYLQQLTWDGAQSRYPDGLPDKVRTLIEHELVLIAELRYEAYFLTVWDLVRFAREQKILCQGRGSAAAAVATSKSAAINAKASFFMAATILTKAARRKQPRINADQKGSISVHLR
jgi:mono/diheme cytochrome c family protein